MLSWKCIEVRKEPVVYVVVPTDYPLIVEDILDIANTGLFDGPCAICGKMLENSLSPLCPECEEDERQQAADRRDEMLLRRYHF